MRTALVPCVSDVFFLYYDYADHPNLHSFPTRRSSDLQIRPEVEEAFCKNEKRVVDILKDIRDTKSAERIIQDRKSTRLNSSHRCISYAVFCLKKKIDNERHPEGRQ